MVLPFLISSSNMALASRRIRIWLTTLTLGLVSNTASSADLLEIWNLALQNDPVYAAARSATVADSEWVNQARASLLPHISATAGLSNANERQAGNLQHYRSSNINQWAVVLRQPIINLSAYKLYERSQQQAGMAVIAEEQARQDLMLRVSQAYFDVLAEQDSLRSLQAQQRAVSHQLQAAQRSFELGGATITDAHEARARLDLLQANIVVAENALQTQRQRLQAIIAQPAPALNPLQSTQLPAPVPAQVDVWTAQAASSNLNVLHSDLAVQATQSLLDANKREHSPTLSIQARSGSASNMGIYGPNTSPRLMDNSIGLELEIPLYSGGEISSRVREQSSRLQQYQYERENARRLAIEATQRYFGGVSSGLLQINALAAAEKSSQAALDANELAYEVGVRINIDVLNAQQQLYETQRALSKARYDTLVNSLRLKEAAGSLSVDDLSALNQLLSPTPSAQPQP